MRQNRILIVANDYTTIYHFRMELLRYLVGQGYDVTIALPDDERNHTIVGAGGTLVSLPLSRFSTNPFVDLRTMAYIRRLIRQVRPAIVLTYTAKPNIYGGLACRLTGTPYVCNVTGLGVNFSKGNLISRIMLMLQKAALKSADTVFFQNSSNKGLFEAKGVVSGNGRLLPGSGVNLEANPYEAYPDHQIVRFIVLGRIRQDKGCDELFDVIRRLHDDGLPAEFHIVGWYEDDRYVDIVEKMRDAYGVRFYGYMLHDDVHRLVADCDCLIQPSHHEGMSNVILEAAATGRPCIVSDIPGCREAVDDEITGYCFAVRDADSLYRRAVQMIRLPPGARRDMGRKAREKMTREFDREIVVCEYAKIIRKYGEEAL